MLVGVSGSRKGCKGVKVPALGRSLRTDHIGNEPQETWVPPSFLEKGRWMVGTCGQQTFPQGQALSRRPQSLSASCNVGPQCVRLGFPLLTSPCLALSMSLPLPEMTVRPAQL